ncbi:MAG TPA: AI-2E family transporter [Ruminiclostridium sp.]|nr:AI-2E family transporter [Ruminiclostridium sp.]
MKESESKRKDYIILISYAVLLYLAVSNIGQVLIFSGYVLAILMPFIVGICFAYVLNILMSFLERKVFYRVERSKKPFVRKLKRPLSLLATFIIFLAFFTGIILFIVPQLTQSISTLTANVSGYLKTLEKFLNNLADRFHLSGGLWSNITFNWNEIITKGSQFISTALPQILTFTLGLTNGIINFITGLIIAVYLLASKEKMILILKKLIFAFIPEKTSAKLIHTAAQANKIFQNFISGQFTEAIILGLLVFIGMLLFRFPYAVLCAVMITITSLIPVLGAWIGAIPSAFIILMADPPRTVWFILFIVVLQQIEGNLIYPKVVGNSIGLDGVWVLFAIIVGGSLFGIAGMLLGVPLLAVIYAIVRRITNRRLKEKNITLGS